MKFEEAMFILQHGSSEGEQKYLLAVKAIGHYIKQLCEENDTLKTEIMAVKSGSDVLKICKLEEENKELKRLIKLAAEDIGKHSFCSMCKNLNDNSKCKKCKAITLDNFKWKYAEETLKLIGDDK